MGLTVGVDIGGTKIAAGVVDDDGVLVAHLRRETPATDPELIEDQVADLVAELRAEHPVDAVGVAAAGFIDSRRGVVLFAPNLSWRDEPVKDELERRVGLPVRLENDANGATWGEFRFGAARDVDDAVMLTVGTGLGGGIVATAGCCEGPVASLASSGTCGWCRADGGAGAATSAAGSSTPPGPRSPARGGSSSPRAARTPSGSASCAAAGPRT